ncbi:MAG: N-formylglutamate amidohydrolase [Rhizobiaceae bacterium]|nr:N-formylglutamate amidohydrolase [Rhizobiaceae bacterium]
MRMKPQSAMQAFEPVLVRNRNGNSPIVLVCDHASNFLPSEYGTLGLASEDLEKHIAWDPGAAEVARHMSDLLDAALIESGISRLVIDCNRPLDAPDLFWTVSENTVVPANQNLSAQERDRRIAQAYQPFHAAVDEIVEQRLASGLETMLVAIHTFTPVYKGVDRPWHIGILHDDDQRLAAHLIDRLGQDKGIVIGDNEPYSPEDRVYFTLERHGRAHGLACVMIEIRNDQVADAASQKKWAHRLAEILETGKNSIGDAHCQL